jgi:glycosyltransferase involved in cell wall biosynthesis
MAVLPSKLESFGIVVLEAALMKKPLIVSRNCGVTGCFVEHGINGLVIDPDSEQDLAQAIKKIITDTPFARVLGQNASERVLMYFSTNAAVAKVEKVYQAIRG